MLKDSDVLHESKPAQEVCRLMPGQCKANCWNTDQGRVFVGNDKLEVIFEFCYLGDMLSAGGCGHEHSASIFEASYTHFSLFSPTAATGLDKHNFSA